MSVQMLVVPLSGEGTVFRHERESVVNDQMTKASNKFVRALPNTLETRLLALSHVPAFHHFVTTVMIDRVGFFQFKICPGADGWTGRAMGGSNYFILVFN